MIKRTTLITLTFAATTALSSQAFSFFSDKRLGPQPVVPPVKLILTSLGQGGVFPPIGPKPTVPPPKIILSSGQGGGFFPPSGPHPFPPTEELPMILAAAEGSTNYRFYGAVIQAVYMIDDAIAQEPHNLKRIPEKQAMRKYRKHIEVATENGTIEPLTGQELFEVPQKPWTVIGVIG